MKILFIDGDNDFDALTFEQEIGKSLLTDKTQDELESKLKEYGIEYTIGRFGKIDPLFIEMTKHTCMDGDHMKTSNFYPFRD
jgi:hypothetical protein